MPFYLVLEFIGTKPHTCEYLRMNGGYKYVPSMCTNLFYIHIVLGPDIKMIHNLHNVEMKIIP